VFSDGRERKSTAGESIGEKIRLGEDIDKGMIRGIREELSIYGDITMMKTGIVEEEHDSPSYPGLRSRYTRHIYTVELSDDQYTADGYIETEGNTTTYFVWEKVDTDI
jgi:precorrin isomerase